MKRSLFCLLTVCLCVFAVPFVSNSVFAQGNGGGSGRGLPPNLSVRYGVQWISVPPEMTGVWVNGMKLVNDQNGLPLDAFVVGWYSRANEEVTHGFIYDHFGSVDPANPGTPRFYDIEELINEGGQGLYPPAWAPTYTRSSCIGVNSNGLITGSLLDPMTGDRKAFYLDLKAELKLTEIPQPPNALAGFTGWRVNEFDQILIKYSLNSGSTTICRCIIYDSISETLGNEIPIDFDPSEEFDFNSLGQVVGTRIDSIGIRYNSDGSIDEFPELVQPHPVLSPITSVNDVGQITGSLAVGNGNRKVGHAFRYDIAGNEEWRDEIKDSSGKAINFSGDILGDVRSNSEYVFHDDWGILNVVDLVLDESDPSNIFREANISNMRLSDRDSTEFGWISGRAHVLQPDGSTQGRPFLLTPIVPGQTPGISVSPTNGLVTTEGLGTDTFNVELVTRPTDDVTIGISSSDASEGTVVVSSLTFTPANWNMQQTVTVTGVDDLDVDGDIAYSIVTAAATSTDPDYNGMVAADVGVTNQDDEQAPIYISLDAPQGIPDNNSGVAISTINGIPAFQNANLNVTLDISHPRPSDLEILLIGPNAAPVQLFNYAGPNNLSNVTSIAGTWTLEVRDTKKRKTGTLIGWSITVQTN